MIRSRLFPTLLCIAACCLAQQSAAAQWSLKSLDPPVLLPDGTEFKTWEVPLEFSKTYYVDGSDPKATDRNPGTKDRPFATINRAAQVVQPGERVEVAAGVYRERISPARGGEGPSRMISYEAAPGAKVVLKGSRIFRETWAADVAAGKTTWSVKLDPKYFEGYNPFQIDNVTERQFEIMDFARPIRGTPPSSLLRGLVFQDGRLLTQVAHRADLPSRAGAHWVDRGNQTLHVRLFGDARPRDAELEIATQETVFAPRQAGLGFIRVKGFVVEQTAGPFPWEQVGAISTTRGHHWIIEENTVRWANGVGIDLGVQLHRWPQPPSVGFHIVRRNTVNDCGICGICGLGPGDGCEFGLLIEDNRLRGNAFHDVERLYETAAIKTHCNVGCLIRRNTILDTLHGPGIWMDWDNRNSRCCQNVIINTRTMAGGIFVEASYVPNLIDSNFIWDTRGNGIYEHDSAHQIIAHNFIGHSSGSGIHLHGQITSRQIGRHEPEYGMHEVANNVLVENALPDKYLGQPSHVAGNLIEGVTAVFDRNRQQLTWSVRHDRVTLGKPVAGVVRDFFGKPRSGPQAAAGPFGQVPEKPEIILLRSGLRD